MDIAKEKVIKEGSVDSGSHTASIESSDTASPASIRKTIRVLKHFFLIFPHHHRMPILALMGKLKRRRIEDLLPRVTKVKE